MLEENKFSYRALLHGKDAEWYFARGLDDITATGSYEVRLFHDDMESLGITTADCDKEHYVVAHLFVSESAATGKQQALRVVGQTLLLTICATNAVKAFTRTCEITPKGASWGSWVDLGAASTTDIQDGSITAQKLNGDVREKIENPLRPLYIAAGAAYNATTGLYSFNGVDDLTDNDMIIIYNNKDIVYRLDYPRIAQGRTGLRTIAPIVNVSQTSQVLLNHKFNATMTFNGATSLEIFRVNSQISIDAVSLDNAVPCEKYFGGVFNGCTNLLKVWPLDFSEVSVMDKSFINCRKLEELRILKLHHNLNIEDCILISKKSILYIINNSAPNSVIAITLHADAYARLADDVDVVAALQAQPLVSLVSA